MAVWENLDKGRRYRPNEMNLIKIPFVLFTKHSVLRPEGLLKVEEKLSKGCIRAVLCTIFQMFHDNVDISHFIDTIYNFISRY